MPSSNVTVVPGASPFSALVTMFHSPSAAFAMLEPRRHAWFPLVLLIASGAALMFWYFSVVDFAWLSDRDEAVRMGTRRAMQAITVGGTVVAVPFVAALAGLYLTIVSKLSVSDFGFAKGFALYLWSSVPSLLALVLGGMQILLTPNGQLDLSQLNPVSLNALFFHVETSNPWNSFLDSLSVLSIWSLILSMIGFQVWAKVSRATAAKVVLIPCALVYAIWAAINLMSKAT